MNKLFLLIFGLLCTVLSVQANQVGVSKNIELFKSLISCDFKKSENLLRNGASTTYVYPGEVFPGGLNVFQLSNYLNCFAKKKMSYETKYELKLKFIHKVKSLLIKHGALDKDIGPYLASEENTPLEKKLYYAIKYCDEKTIKDLLTNKKVNPNVRFFSIDREKGKTIYAIATATTCNMRKSYQKNKYLNFINKKKSLLKLMINLGAKPNTLIPLTNFNNDIIKYIPAYWFALYRNNDDFDYGIKMALISIKIGANPNAYSSLGNTILHEMIRTKGVYNDYFEIFSNGMNLLNENIQGKSQYNLFPIWDLSHDENEKIFDIFLKSKRSYAKEKFDLPMDNPLLRIIFNYLYMNKSRDLIIDDKKTEEKFQLFTESIFKRNPHFIEKSDQEKLAPLKWMMVVICPVSENNENESFKNKFSFNIEPELNFIQRKASAYKWFLNLLETIKISSKELNKKDMNGNNILDYSIHLCPSQVVRILSERGAEFSIGKNNFIQQFKDSLNFKHVNYKNNNMAFNNDFENLMIYSDKKRIDISSLSRLTFTNKRIQEYINQKKINIVKWSSLSDFSIIDNKITINGSFNLNYMDHMDIKTIDIDIYKLKIGETFNFPIRLLEFGYGEKNSNDYNINKQISRRETKVTYIGSYKEDLENIKWYFFNLTDNSSVIPSKLIKIPIYNDKKSFIRLKYQNSNQNKLRTKTKELQIKIDLMINQGIVEKKSFKIPPWVYDIQEIQVSSRFTCTNLYWCNYIKVKEEAGDIFLTIDTNQMRKGSTELFLMNYLQGNEKEKEEILENIVDNNSIEYANVMIDLFFKEPNSFMQNIINTRILEIIFPVTIQENIEYNWDKLYMVIKEMRPTTNSSRFIFNFVKYFIGSEISSNELAMDILINQNYIEQFEIIFKLVREKPFLKEKLNLLIKAVKENMMEELKISESFKKYLNN